MFGDNAYETKLNAEHAHTSNGDTQRATKILRGMHIFVRIRKTNLNGADVPLLQFNKR